MNIEIGIIGLPQSGRTTVFNALTGGEADTARHTRDGAAHVGMATFADPRLEVLTDILKPKKTVPVSVSYIDIGASVKGMVEGSGISGQLLGQLSKVDALINVVREFRDDSIPHSESSLDMVRDINTMDLELAFSDLAIIERRLGRIEVSLKGAKPAERQLILREQELLIKIKTGLEAEVPVRQQELTGEERKTINNFQFLTAKPLLVVANIGEDRLSEAGAMEADLNSAYSRPGCRVMAFCGKLEMELAALDSETEAICRAEYGLTESGLNRVIGVSYELLGLVTFFTTASSEVRAWSVTSGSEAPVAAGKIHSDMERGFIRAEVVSYDDLVKCGSLAEARKLGLLRTEGKSYTVKDGDVITFLFNV